MTDADVDLQSDLTSRWTPDSTQIRAASKAFTGSSLQHVYTLHLLLGKEPNFWTADIVVRRLPGLWINREIALDALDQAAREHFTSTGQPVVGGWTTHGRDGHWAVFEDFLAAYPKRL